MKKTNHFAMDSRWIRLFDELGISSTQLLRQAALPDDVFQRKNTSLSSAEYFQLWQTLEILSNKAPNDVCFPLRMLRSLNDEVFDPLLFAAYCSPNLNAALRRLSQLKPLFEPVQLVVEQESEKTSLKLNYLDLKATQAIPVYLIATELGFLVQLARMATRSNICPLRVISPQVLPTDYTEFFGVKPELGEQLSLVFSAEDARKTFTTENTQMWAFFIPELRKPLVVKQTEDSMATQVRSLLLEMLPSGQASVDELASRLLLSRRTLQRRLNDEKTSFKAVLSEIREQLARHYIMHSELSYIQIAFLLGYDDPNSFFRAFHTWTGLTPETLRIQSK